MNNPDPPSAGQETASSQPMATYERAYRYAWYSDLKQLPFWRNPWVSRSAPLGASILLHMVIGLIALAVVPPLINLAKNTSQEQVIIPDASLTSSDLGGIINPGLGKDPTRQSAQENDPNPADNRGWADRKSQSLAQALNSSIGEGREISSSVGSGSRANALGAFGEESGGRMTNFGPRGGGGGDLPKSKIFGHGSNIRSVLYVCDWSGSLVGTKEQVLRSELRNAVANLAPIQAFNVLIFQEAVKGDSHYLAVNPSIMMATPSNKAKTFDFVKDINPRGSTNPIPALTEAFRQKPQLIYLLTDGDFDSPSGEQVLAKINDLNRDKMVHVNTILLLGTKKEQDDYKDFEVTMGQIASQNGGEYKKFYCDDF